MAASQSPEQVGLSERAYRKLVLHASKYPSASVVGLLVGKTGSRAYVEDVLPLTHHWSELSPMTEAGLAMVRTVPRQNLLTEKAAAHAENSKTTLLGAYEAPAALEQTEASPTTRTLANKIAQQNGTGNAVVLVANGKQLLQPATTALLATVEQGQKNAKQLARSAVDVDGYEKILSRLRSEVHGGTWERLADWDDHLENPEADWLTNAAVA